ncbi:MAG: divalent-cation tolerance protein CutA [Cyanobacteriota bacterium]|nr:divalent-cation tolerance protein CutA [Cyanobacteriota bacterium]
MQPNSTDYGIVLVTTSSREEGEAIASVLLENRLAACISLAPIHSIYMWKGKVNSDAEWQLMIKTDLTHFDALEAKIREYHSYEVPEIIALPIVAGSLAYLQWIGENVISVNN